MTPRSDPDDPGARAGDPVGGDASGVPDALLARVRALLDKAESTTFEAEAHAFTAKAQELMARHRIDRAMLDAAGRGAVGAPSASVGRTDIALPDPYARQKFLLLSRVGQANDVRAVWCRHEGTGVVFGHDVDRAVTETLFTSLLVQATTAVQREGSKFDRAGRNRTRRFRRAFLTGFAERIGHRLADATAAVARDADAERGEVLPVLAARLAVVEDAVAAAFPSVRSMSVSISDGEGLLAGRLAADRADLAAGSRLVG